MGPLFRGSKVMHLFSKTFESDPYAQLAPYYDRLMDSVDYDEWSLYIDLLFNRYGRKVTDVIDGGCGTGSIASSLFKLGYRVHGFDRSFEMLRNLKQKE